jgi:hypothetical protein
MSQQAVESVIGKAVMDAAFRDLLIADPEKALADFDLTDTEKAGLKSLDSETLNSLGNTLETRASKMRLF